MSVVEDLSKCLIDISKCPANTRLVDHFSELSAFSEFTLVEDDNLIKIAILTADRDSPFLKIKERKYMLHSVFDFLNIDLSTDENQKIFQEVFEYRNLVVSGCWARYYQMQYDITFTEWAMTKQSFDILLFELNRQKEDNETELQYVNRRTKITRDLKDVGTDLKALEAEIFPDSKLKRAIALNEIKKIKNYPEKHAMKHSIM